LKAPTDFSGFNKFKKKWADIVLIAEAPFRYFEKCQLKWHKIFKINEEIVTCNAK